jgi:hypothetical protein
VAILFQPPTLSVVRSPYMMTVRRGARSCSLVMAGREHLIEVLYIPLLLLAFQNRTRHCSQGTWHRAPTWKTSHRLPLHQWRIKPFVGPRHLSQCHFVGPNSIRTLLPVFLVPPPPPLHCALDNYGRRRSRTRISKKTLKKQVRKQPSYTVTLIIVVTIEVS